MFKLNNYKNTMTQNSTKTIGSIKRPGTYQQVKVISGVVGQGGGIFQIDNQSNSVNTGYNLDNSTTVQEIAIQKPLSTLTPTAQQTGLKGAEQRIQNLLGVANTKRIRGESNLFNELSIGGLAGTSTVLNYIRGYAELPSTVIKLIKDPSLIKKIPSQISEQAGEFGNIIRTSPTEAVARIGTNILLLSGEAKVLNKLGEVGEKVSARLSPKFIGEVTGETKSLKLVTATGKNIKLDIARSIPKENFVQQVKKAGRSTTAISTQADSLINLIKNERIIRKPIPNENKLTSTGKRLLNKFDTGKITKKELIKLDNEIKKIRSKGILERSFFADPTGKLRPSRLGILFNKEYKGNLIEKLQNKYLDFVTEDLTLIKKKPQVLYFENAKIEKFPAKLQKVVNKVLNQKTLTKKELSDLLEFQLTKSGKFKPLGFTTRESEITLAPGEIITLKKKIGIAIIKGRKVPILQVDVLKPTGKLKQLIKDFQIGKLSKNEIKNLDKLLNKKTRLNYKLSSLKPKSAKYFSIQKRGIQSISALSKIISKSNKKAYSPSDIKKIVSSPKFKSIVNSKTITSLSTKPSPKRPASGSTYKGSVISTSKPKPYIPPKTTTSKYTSKLSVSKPYIKPPIINVKPPIKLLEFKLNQSQGYKRVGTGYKKGFYVYQKIKNKFIKITTRPLNQNDAIDRLTYRLDNNFSRTARLVPVIGVKKFGKITSKERNYFNKNKSKFRNFKIRKGMKIKNPLTVIEKRKYAFDKRGERKQIKHHKVNKVRKPIKKGK